MVQEAYHTLFPYREKETLCLKYTSQPPLAEKEVEAWYINQYASRRDYEARVAATLIGPHRDDIEWSIQERPLRSLASLGQARSAALALRLAEWKLLFNRSHEEPIFLIDDFESSLDAERRSFMLSTCASFEQTILTAHALQDEKSSRIELRYTQTSGGIGFRQLNELAGMGMHPITKS
jgi:recombinational DNA repair ATPase RecF